MNKLPLILIGGGGHCHSCIDVIEQEGKYAIRGILDPMLKPGSNIFTYPVLGGDKIVDQYASSEIYFLITIGQIKCSGIRVKLFEKLKSSGAKIATVISPRAHVSVNSVVGEGTIIMHGALVNAGATIGSNSIINSFSLVEHDCFIGNNVHISTGALINGCCSVGDESFIGSGSIVRNNISIGGGIVVGAGSLVIKNLIEPGLYKGSPVNKSE